jgi:prophage antirepressor-like protein
MDDIVVYNDGELELNVSVEEENIWLKASDIALIFDVQRPAITKHINNIFNSKELVENVVCSILEHTASDGKRYKTKFYNLDMIISIGYRVNSIKATKFRQWATTVLKSYIQNNYTINEHKINEQRLSLLENDVASIKSHIKHNSLELRQGIFYNGEVFDAYVFISNLIKSTNKSIVIIDNYIDESILTLLSKNPNINIIIYTQNTSKQLKLDIEKYNKQYNNLEVKITKKFHDRFMIIDENELYHIGASLKDLGSKVFAFSKLELDSDDIVRKVI